jgi:hypothetical protein
MNTILLIVVVVTFQELMLQRLSSFRTTTAITTSDSTLMSPIELKTVEESNQNQRTEEHVNEDEQNMNIVRQIEWAKFEDEREEQRLNLRRATTDKHQKERDKRLEDEEEKRAQEEIKVSFIRFVII